MENVGLFVAGVLAVAGAISTLGGAANWLVKLVQALKAPNTEQDKQLAELQEWRRGVDEKLDNDNRRLNNSAESERITQRALYALLSHGIDGNHVELMKKSKDELQEYLFSK